jgi:DNA repair exonuclease SbcCD nuclease subunit
MPFPAMKILRSADWQLGCSFRSFGEKASELRQERLNTFRRTLQLARDQGVEAPILRGTW